MTLLTHHHIFKNAGTTVDWILEKNFPGEVLYIEGDEPGARLNPVKVRAISSDHPNHRAISSHTFPLPDAGNAWAEIHLVVLRDPIERYHSIYRYERGRMDSTPANLAARELDFGDYCRWWLNAAPGIWLNWQTRSCTPQWPKARVQDGAARTHWSENLDAALGAITETATVVTVDRFDEGMLLLESALRRIGLEFDASYLRQNVSDAPARQQGRWEDLLGGELHSELVAANANDFALLAHARELIEARYKAIDPLGSRLLGFRRRCSYLNNSKDNLQVRVPGQDAWILVPESDT